MTNINDLYDLKFKAEVMVLTSEREGAVLGVGSLLTAAFGSKLGLHVANTSQAPMGYGISAIFIAWGVVGVAFSIANQRAHNRVDGINLAISQAHTRTIGLP